jgi:hopene-associated glycosyltransferase HpnB
MLPEIAGSLAIAVWLYLLLGRGCFWREFRLSAPDPAPEPAGSPRVAVVIPARNEASGLGQAIESLAGQQPMHIVVVDDASDDGTADAARQAAPAGLLTVIAGEPLPAGWTGKLWAVEQGVRHAVGFDPDYLLLTDADIVHAPDSLAALVGRAQSGGYDLVSYMATLHCRSLAERALVPAFVYFFLALYPPAWIRDPRRRTAGAAGGCILVRREALERIGGIASIRGELIDDCALARAVKQSGGRVWLGLSAGTRSIREYATFAEVESTIARTAFTQLRHSAALLAGTVAALGVTYLLAPALALAAPPRAAALGAAAWLLMSASYSPALRFYRRSILWAPLLPAVAVFYAWATVHSAIDSWRGAGGLWKGRAQDASAR